MELKTSDLTFQPLTSDGWADFEQLFGSGGGYGGCWCMWWRCTRREFEANSGAGNRKAMRALVDAGIIPGILAYVHMQPAGWCSVAPRENYGSLERSPVLKRIDSKTVWSIVCFYVDKSFRKRGLMGALIDAAVSYASAQGASIVEAYPTITLGRKLAPVSSFMGTSQIFLDHGFKIVAEPSETRRIVRKYLK